MFHLCTCTAASVVLVRSWSIAERQVERPTVVPSRSLVTYYHCAPSLCYASNNIIIYLVVDNTNTIRNGHCSHFFCLHSSPCTFLSKFVCALRSSFVVYTVTMWIEGSFLL
ncbi:hypothetical protein EDB92DRAFT_171464 [Lactarius akahatsu]|uniref:Secreted protein n=1 Tax=Lactarius akahatsu TaxID=416441 RepID=A0AAD4L9Z5_9AGAM|nr:hypothetical protein EDB92DRAFT_171464 [Lactarius akahatsu]